MKRAAVAVLAAMILLLNGATVQAAPLEQMCQPTAVQQHDVAGVYVSPEWRIRVEVYGCGGVFVQWTNSYGEHAGTYVTTRRLTDGSLIAESISGSMLDNSAGLGIKPAEPGFVQVITSDRYASTYKIYRLRKLA